MTADKVTEAPVEWLWNPYLARGRVTMLVGESAVGKSTLLAAFIAHVTSGRFDKCKEASPPGRALMYSPEEDLASETRNRLRAAGAALERVHFGDMLASGREAPLVHLPDKLDRLAELVKSIGARLLVFDPITDYLSPGITGNSGVEVRTILTPLIAMAARLDVSVVCTLHYRKGRTGGPLDWVAGSAAWTQVPRFVIALGRDPHQPTQRVITMPKNSLLKAVESRCFEIEDVDDVGRFVLGPPSALSAAELGMPAEDAEDRDLRAEARLLLRELLAEEERAANELVAYAQSIGISSRTLRRAKKDMGVSSKLVHHAGRPHQVWQRPEKWPD